MTNDNQDALRCADELATGENFYYESSMSYDYILSEASANAAAHIRRLVAENERLQKLCDERGSNEARMFLRCRELSDQVAALGAKGESATALVQRMLEALAPMLTAKLADGTYADKDCKITFAITAASEWLGQKGETK